MQPLGRRSLAQRLCDLRIVQERLQQRLQIRIAKARHPVLQLRPHFPDIALRLRNKIAQLELARRCPANLLHFYLQPLVEPADLAADLDNIAGLERPGVVDLPHPPVDLSRAIRERQRKIPPAIPARAHLLRHRREEFGNLPILPARQIRHHYVFHLVPARARGMPVFCIRA